MLVQNVLDCRDSASSSIVEIKESGSVSAWGGGGGGGGGAVEIRRD